MLREGGGSRGASQSFPGLNFTFRDFACERRAQGAENPASFLTGRNLQPLSPEAFDVSVLRHTPPPFIPRRPVSPEDPPFFISGKERRPARIACAPANCLPEPKILGNPAGARFSDGMPGVQFFVPCRAAPPYGAQKNKKTGNRT